VTRPRSSRLWTLALWILCLLAATGGVAEARPLAGRAGPPSAAMSSGASTPDSAVLPVRAGDEVDVAVQHAPLRMLFLAGVVAVLVARPAASRRGSSVGAQGRRILRNRRSAIALRAPPLRLA
jgi:hypothetical protein